MESLTSFRTRLIARREDLRRMGALVDPVRLLDAIIAELDEVSRCGTEPLLNLTQAARECGYSPDALGRMVRDGRIPNHGRRGAPKVLRSDLPRRAGWPALRPPRPIPSRTFIARNAVRTQPDRPTRLA